MSLHEYTVAQLHKRYQQRTYIGAKAIKEYLKTKKDNRC